MYFVLTRAVKTLHKMVWLWLTDEEGGTDRKGTAYCPVFPFPFTSSFSVYVVTATGFNGSFLELHVFLRWKQILESKFLNGKPGPVGLSALWDGPPEFCAQETSPAGHGNGA